MRLVSIPEDSRESEESKSRVLGAFSDSDGSITEFLGSFVSVESDSRTELMTALVSAK